MDIINLVNNLSPEMYLRLKSAVETGKWPEGTEVAQAQRESAMHIVMAYQSKILKSDDIMTVGADGQIVNKSKRELKTQFASNSAEQTDVQLDNEIARFSQL
ncbi:MAG: DUF1315 family protein [Alteromonadaceae bacterium]|nr:DUF1315 family protein [Alteromonadaceae bacterium]